MSDKKQPNLTDMLNSFIGAGGAIDPSMLKREYAWYNSFSYPDVPSFQLKNVMAFAESALFIQALASGGTVYSESLNFGSSKLVEISIDGFRKVIANKSFMFFVAPNAAIQLSFSLSSSLLTCYVISLDKNLLERSLSKIKEFYE